MKVDPTTRVDERTERRARAISRNRRLLRLRMNPLHHLLLRLYPCSSRDRYSWATATNSRALILLRLLLTPIINNSNNHHIVRSSQHKCNHSLTLLHNNHNSSRRNCSIQAGQKDKSHPSFTRQPHLKRFCDLFISYPLEFWLPLNLCPLVFCIIPHVPHLFFVIVVFYVHVSKKEWKKET